VVEQVDELFQARSTGSLIPVPEQLLDLTGAFAFYAVHYEAALSGYWVPVEHGQDLCFIAESVVDGEMAFSRLVASFESSFVRMTLEDRLDRLGHPLEWSGIRAYVVSKLTGLTDDEHTQVTALCDEIKSDLGRRGIEVHLPIDNTDPAQKGDEEARHIHEVDFRAVLEADFLVCILDTPTTGGGKEISWAERNCAPVLLVSHGFNTSRLLTGSTSIVEDKYWNSEDGCKPLFDEFLSEHEVEIWTHAVDQILKPGHLEEMFARVCRAQQIAVQNLSKEWPALISSDRMGEICESELYLDNTSVCELRQIAGAAGMELFEMFGASRQRLTPGEMFGLLEASKQGWPVDRILDLALEADREELALAPREPLTFELWEERYAERWPED
jgi:hypothetical protein